jgi:hypothetical protein
MNRCLMPLQKAQAGVRLQVCLTLCWDLRIRERTAEAARLYLDG